MEIPIKMDDLGVPPFQETPIWSYGKTCQFYAGNDTISDSLG